MKKLLGLLLVSFGLSVAAGAQATPTAPVAGTDYQVLQTAVPPEAQGKIAVTEFFWYGCPHCAAFEPTLEAWLKKQGKDVDFKRVPVAFRKDFEPHQRLYYALLSLGKVNELTPMIFNAIQKEKNYLLTPEAQADFVAKHGVDRKAFLAAYNSFSTQSDVQRANQLIDSDKIDGVPAIIVQGKSLYLVSPTLTDASLAKSNNKPKSEVDIFNGMTQTIDALLQQIRDKKL